MKEILVVDAPNNCSECPCCHENECGNQYKGYVGDYLGWNSGRPSWCPLKPMPKKLKLRIQREWITDYDRYEIGYNACIDKIMGETE